MAEEVTESLLKYAELLHKKGMQEEALAPLQELLQRDPDCARAHFTLAVIRASQGSPEEAASHFQEALRLAPAEAKSWNGLGVALQQMGRPDQAATCYQKAVRINPRYQEARINLALLLKKHGRLSEAERLLCEGLRLEPKSVRLIYNLANVLHVQGRSLEAVAGYREALRLDPQHLDAQQNLLFALHYSPQFSDRQIFTEHLRAGRKKMFRADAVQRAEQNTAGRRIRIGYLSPDFRDHSVARFIEPVLLHHDTTRFEIFCYANVARPDETTDRLRRTVEHWVDLQGKPDDQAATAIAHDGIDILIDLAGHTSGNRLPLFARRPAPLQITWIGYPDTTAMPQIDYRITDVVADPPGRERFHTERLIRLPRTFCCYLPPQECPHVASLPFDHTGRVTFGSFNNLAKVTPEMIVLWARVLQAVPDSTLLLKGGPLADPEVRARFLRQFNEAGVQPGRIELHSGEPSASEHLAHYGRVDIALDTFPYNGTTTTCEALWMGVPVITLAGSRHASRTGASILTSCCLGDLIAGNPEGYILLARRLAENLQTLRTLRRELRGRMQASPLMDAAGVTRELEQALKGVVGE